MPPMTWKPFHFLVVAISGWMDREQQEVIDYLREENRILRERHGGKRRPGHYELTEAGTADRR
jgi:hypothetical protein